MYAVSASVAVNPPGAAPVLTQAQVWHGLVMKADNALPFVAAMESCTVVERYDDGLLREIILRGDRLRERITFTPPVQVHFRRVGDGGPGGWIANLISESSAGLLLTFTFAMQFPGLAAGSETEQRQGEMMKESYIRAVASTLRAVRQLVGEGKLP